MKKILLSLWGAYTMFFSLIGAEELPIVKRNIPVRVQYQIKRPAANSWTTINANLWGTVSESMMINALSLQHPGHSVRILAVYAGKIIRVKVRYQFKRWNSAWTTATATLTNAVTGSMARNQLLQRHPGTQVRILSIIIVR